MTVILYYPIVSIDFQSNEELITGKKKKKKKKSKLSVFANYHSQFSPNSEFGKTGCPG